MAKSSMYLAFCILIGNCFEIDYRFSNNIGQIFYDYSGNNLHAVNGDSHLNQTNDVAYSDRGIYFSKDIQIVTLPPNTLITTGFTLTSPFSIILWFYAFEKQNQIALYRRHISSDFSKRFSVYQHAEFKLKYYCAVSICTPNTGSTYEFTNSKIIQNIWEIFVVSVDNTTFKFSSTGNLKIINTFRNSYSENGLSLFTHLGKTSAPSGISMKCFMYRFMILNNLVDINDLYSSSTSSSCPTAFIFESNSYCLASISNQSLSSNNTTCSCSYGCSNDISCLNPLICEFNSTFFHGSNLYCFCGNSINNTNCISALCNQDCLACFNNKTCKVCKDPNSIPFDSNGCICKRSFFNTSSLLNSSCIPCMDEGLSCNSSSTCNDCRDPNAILNSSNRCICKDQFYLDDGDCKNCDIQCKTCSQSGKCLSCIAENTTLINDDCKCNNGYYNISILDKFDSCIKCMDICKTCNSAYSCIDCLDNARPGANGCDCIAGYSYDNTSNSCNSCGGSCSNCSKENSYFKRGKCLCKPGFYLSDDKTSCLNCSKECITCDNSENCTECKPEAFIIETRSDSKLCSFCVPECKICNESRKCVECVDNNTVIIHNRCICKEGYWNQTSLIDKNSCNKCGEYCASCTNDTSCSSCKLNNANISNNCLCNNRYYLSKDECLNCSYKCKNCIKYELCIDCIEPYKPFDGYCTCPTLESILSNKCTQSNFSAYLKVNEANKLMIIFKSPLKTKLN